MQQNNLGDNDPPGHQRTEVLITILFLMLCAASQANSLTSYAAVFQMTSAPLCSEDMAGGKSQHIAWATNKR